MKLQVRSFTPPEGKGPFKVMLSDGKEYRTFDAQVYGGITIGQWGEAISSIKSRTYNNKQYDDLMLDSWTPADAPEGQQGPSEQQSEAKTDWDAKDRTIAMESAYSSASKFYAGRDIQPAAVASLARSIYRDIQRARSGETFEPKSEQPAQ